MIIVIKLGCGTEIDLLAESDQVIKGSVILTQIVEDYIPTNAGESCSSGGTRNLGPVLLANIRIEEYIAYRDFCLCGETHSAPDHFRDWSTAKIYDLLMAANYIDAPVLLESLARNWAQRLKVATDMNDDEELLRLLHLTRDLTAKEQSSVMDERKLVGLDMNVCVDDSRVLCCNKYK